MNSVDIGELEVSKKSSSWINYFCPVCQIVHDGGKNGTFIAAQGSTIGTCMKPSCKETLRITNGNELTFTKKTMSKLPNITPELREQFGKGEGQVGTTQKSAPKIDIRFEMPEGYAKVLQGISKEYEGREDEFAKTWIPAGMEDVEKRVTLVKNGYAKDKQPNYKVWNSGIAVFNERRPMWSERRIDEISPSDFDTAKKEKWRTQVGAFWYIKDESDEEIWYDKNGSHFLSGHIKIAHTKATGEIVTKEDPFIVEIMEDGTATIMRKNEKLFTDIDETTEEEVNTAPEKETSVTDTITEDDLQF